MPHLLVDGYNLAFRSFYGMPELNRSDGLPTNAIHGWVRTLWYLEDNQKPERMVVFFDLGGSQRHLDIREDYKAQRGETPPELEQQMPYIKDITRAMGYGGIEENGVEADDLIGAWAKKLSEEGVLVKIVSADKDLGQCLIWEGVTQLSPPPTANPRLGWRDLDAKKVEGKFGVHPKLIPDYLALVGDTSDNIPGIPGVGPKTASKWLNLYGSLQGVIDHSGELNPKRFQQVVHKHREELQKNLEMTTLDPKLVVDSLDCGPADGSKVVSLLEELEMKKGAEDARKRYGV